MLACTCQVVPLIQRFLRIAKAAWRRWASSAPWHVLTRIWASNKNILHGASRFYHLLYREATHRCTFIACHFVTFAALKSKQWFPWHTNLAILNEGSCLQSYRLKETWQGPAKHLGSWYPHNSRDLPWAHSGSTDRRSFGLCRIWLAGPAGAAWPVHSSVEQFYPEVYHLAQGEGKSYPAKCKA